MSSILKFYQDTPHSCSYLSEQQAQNIYPDPGHPMSNSLYSQLIQHGFRRSGNHAYRPYCPDCKECIPVRININQFTTNRSQRRCLQRNSHLTISPHPAEFNPEHYQLYERYLMTRHSGGGMDNPTEESYLNFLTCEWNDAVFLEFRDQSKLVAVAVTDYVHDGLSSFYTFFDPERTKQSLGTYAILQQVNLAQTQRLSWVYLGYWIKDCQKMRYKQTFAALEGYIDQRWQSLKT
ncbi:MAG: arginyltransferase [Gammaproteobacteria bacterium]|nr:arginyltransferase [Gammaproteobacteria bacterium]MDH5591582.1 arginyltransferase [Gammaproteobacteria bacterium]